MKDKRLHILLRKRPISSEVLQILESNPGSAKIWRMGYLPLHIGIKNYDISPEIIKALLNAYPDSSKAANKDGDLPLHIAFRRNASYDVIRVLLDRSSVAVISSLNNMNYLPLHIALCKQPSSVDDIILLTELIDKYPDSVKLKNGNQLLPLQIALKNHKHKNSLVLFKRLLQYYPEAVMELDKIGLLPLHLAIRWKVAVEILSVLLEVCPGAAKTKDRCGRLALHYASSAEVVRVLLHTCPEAARVADNDGSLALHVAVFLSSELLPTVQTLLDAYPEAVKWEDNNGRLPLHRALSGRNAPKVVKALLQASPESPRCADKKGLLPLHYALKNSASTETILLLLQLFPDVARQPIDNGDLPLHIAVAEYSPREVVVKLLEIYPEAIKCTNKRDEFPFHISIQPYCLPPCGIRCMLLELFPQAAASTSVRLALHTALDGRSPSALILAILKAYPDAAKIACKIDHNLPLVRAIEHSASTEVLKAILRAYPEAAGLTSEPKKLLPLNLLLRAAHLDVDAAIALLDAYPQAVNSLFTWPNRYSNVLCWLIKDRRICNILTSKSPEWTLFYAILRKELSVQSLDAAVNECTSSLDGPMKSYCMRLLLLAGPPSHRIHERREANYKARREGLFMLFKALYSQRNIFGFLRETSDGIDNVLIRCVISFL